MCVEYIQYVLVHSYEVFRSSSMGPGAALYEFHSVQLANHDWCTHTQMYIGIIGRKL